MVTTFKQKTFGKMEKRKTTLAIWAYNLSLVCMSEKQFIFNYSVEFCTWNKAKIFKMKAIRSLWLSVCSVYLCML